MSSSLLEIDYRKAYRQADELDGIARDAKQIAEREVEEGIASVSDNWKGDNSDKFQKKCRKIQSDAKVVADEIKEIASAVREIARAAEEAEREARRLAEERTSS